MKWASFCNQSSYFPDGQSKERLIWREKQRQIELICRTEKIAATQSCNLGQTYKKNQSNTTENTELKLHIRVTAVDTILK